MNRVFVVDKAAVGAEAQAPTKQPLAPKRQAPRKQPLAPKREASQALLQPLNELLQAKQ